ncbi:chemotaxis protein CheX [Desulfobacterales bacterium HSG17]|nr:chemotaxis protein CheX [Desulfobacterales bacterium HSG17]
MPAFLPQKADAIVKNRTSGRLLTGLLALGIHSSHDVPAYFESHLPTQSKVTDMDAKLINPFIKATIEVIKTMASVTPSSKKPYLKKDDAATGDVSSIVGITGKTNGTIAFSFSGTCILKIVSNMFGEDVLDLDEEVADAVGEIANMVSGQARQELETIGFLFDGAIPSVFMGEGHSIIHMTDGPKIAIPFTTPDGGFTLEACFEA